MPPGPNDATTLSGGGTLTTNANDAFIAYGSFQISGTESTVQVPLPFTGTVTKLRVFVTTAPGAGNDWVLTVRKNETNTALTCTIAGAFTTCNDNSVVTITAGDLLDLRVSPTGSPELTTITWSAKIAP
jgi:hypothetical protein